VQQHSCLTTCLEIHVAKVVLAALDVGQQRSRTIVTAVQGRTWRILLPVLTAAGAARTACKAVHHRHVADGWLALWRHGRLCAACAAAMDWHGEQLSGQADADACCQAFQRHTCTTQAKHGAAALAAVQMMVVSAAPSSSWCTMQLADPGSRGQGGNQVALTGALQRHGSGADCSHAAAAAAAQCLSDHAGLQRCMQHSEVGLACPMRQ